MYIYIYVVSPPNRSITTFTNPPSNLSKSLVSACDVQTPMSQTQQDILLTPVKKDLHSCCQLVGLVFQKQIFAVYS